MDPTPVTQAAAASAASPATPRVCLGQNAPAEMADFISRAGIELLPHAHRSRASIYVDFVGACPTGIEVVLSFDFTAKGERAPRATADLATDKWQAAALLVISHALRLKPVLLSADAAMLSVLRSAITAATSHLRLSSMVRSAPASTTSRALSTAQAAIAAPC
jgi:hypothetical protein